MPTGTNTIVVLSALDVVFRIFIHYLSNAKLRKFFCIQKIFFQQNEKKERKNPLVYEKKKLYLCTANMSEACFEMLCNVTKNQLDTSNKSNSHYAFKTN